MLHNVRDMGHGACRIASRTTVHLVLVVLVVVHGCCARVHDRRKIRRTIRRPARGPAHDIRAVARAGKSLETYRE